MRAIIHSLDERLTREAKMFLTNKQAEERLNSEKNLANRFGKKDSFNSFNTRELVNQEDSVKESNIISIEERTILSAGKNRINLSEEERTNIAIESRAGLSTQVEIARAAGLNNMTVQNIHSGKTKGIDEERVKKTLDSVRDTALERLMSSLGLLTDDKLSGCSAKDLSVIASNMGRVVEKIQPKETQPDNINFIIYAPELKQEKYYETVEI